MDHKERTRRVAAAAALISIVTSVAYSELRLSDPTSEVYYNYAAVAGAVLQVEKDAEIAGDLFSNGDVQLKKDSTVDGDVSAAGGVDSRGTVSGTVTEGAPALKLPEILDEAAWRELADRVFEDDELVLEDEVIDDVVFVAGTVHLRGRISGTGTVIAGGDVRLDSTGGGPPPLPDPSSRLSFVALKDIRLGRDRAFRGVLRAGHDVEIETGADFEGVAVADNLVHVKQGARVRFFDFDQVPPTVELVEPADGGFVADSTPRIELAFADDLSGVRVADTVFSLDGAERTAEAEVSVEGLVFIPAEALAEGLHGHETVIFDHSDNEGRGAFTFTVDTVAPAVSITSPATSPVVNDATPAIAVAYGDETSGVDLASLAISLDGVDLTAGCTVTDDGATCEPPALDEGLHTVEAGVSDRAGNAASASFSFEVIFDTEGPVITVLSPTDGETVTEETLTVTGTVTDKSPIAGVSVNGAAATLTEQSFSATITLVPGLNTVQVDAADIFGNASSVTLEVTFAASSDTTPPLLAIVHPSAGVFVVAAQPDIELRYSDDKSGVDRDSLAFTLDGQPLAVQCSTTSSDAVCIPETALPEGDARLAASLRDLAGNAATAEVAFVVDTEGVAIDIEEPADGFLTRDAAVPINGTAGPDVTSLRINGVAATLTGGRFSAFFATVPLREGTNMVVVSATKANGNTGTASVEVTRDVSAPIVKIDTPRDGFVAITDKITVTGLVNDVVTGGVEPRVLVNGFEAPAAGGSFMLVDLPLVPGPNTIEAVATDAVGNEGRDTIDVTFQPPVGARLLLADGDGQFDVVRATLAEPLVVVIEDDFGNPLAGRLVRFEVTRNSGTLRADALGEPQRVVQVAADGAGRAAVFLTLGDTAGEGNNRVRATAVGVAGEVEFCATALPAQPNKILMIEGDHQRGLVGQPLAAPLEAMVLDMNGNPIAGAPVIFTVVDGGGNLDGAVEITRFTDIDGIARAVHTLGFSPGIGNNVVRAETPGVLGLPATFVATALSPGDPDETRLKGLVLDNSQTPIPGAVVSFEGSTASAVTDADGQFLLTPVPSGRIVLQVDPSGSPRPELFPPLQLETVTVAGQLNEIGQPIMLPTLDTTTVQVVGGDEDVTLAMEGVGGLTLTVFAGSATFPDGSKTGPMSISQVHLDKVPMQPPNGSIFMPPAWTIQPSGVVFDPPAKITIPNDGLPIGRVIDIFQFDHTLNEFIDVGKGTVSEDGSVIVSDPGFGITRTGWGGCGQPQPPPTCPSSCDDGNDCTRDFCQDGSCRHEPIFPDGCDDGKECTVNDRCQEGECKGDPVAEGTPCGGSTDEAMCTFDACDDAGNCETGQPKEDGTPCDDMEFCTDPDECMGGQCMGEEPEDMDCAPIDVDGDIGFGPYDVVILEVPEVKAMLDLTLDVTKECCEEKMNRESLTADGDGTYSGSVSGLGIGVPGPGTLVRLIDRIVCKKIINRIPQAECEVGVDVVVDGVSVMGALGVTDDQCAMTTQWRGSGDITVNGIGIDGSVKVTLFGQSLGVGLSGTADVTGTIEGAQNGLLVTFSVSGVTVTGTITLPIVGPLSLDGTTPPVGSVGPFSTPAPGFATVCL